MLPGATVTSREEDWELMVALRAAFDALEREVEKY
jgi:ribosome-associated translation inhibitor RaiA